MNRRQFLHTTSAALALPPWSRAAEPFRTHRWERDARNPILKPGGGAFDANRCMHPFVVTHEGQYWLFYCGNGYGKTGIGTAVAEAME